MKIGILTFHRAHNYGAVLQCYALQQVLSVLGHEVCVVDYRQRAVEKRYKAFVFARALKHLLRPSRLVRYFRESAQRARRGDNFLAFTKQYLNLSEPCYKSMPEGIDLYVVGSDQMWGLHCTAGVDRFYFGDFDREKSVRIAGYAISTNVASMAQLSDERLTAYAQNFSSLSFRESTIAELVAQRTSLPTRVDVDPTLLADKHIWEGMINTKWQHRKYVLVYQVRGKDDVREKLLDKARTLAQKLDCEVIDMSDISYVPEDFVSLFKYAQSVVTSSFHASVFSVIFERPLYAVRLNDGHDGRYSGLLHALGAESMLVDLDFDPVPQTIDYEPIKRRLEELRTSSLEYLRTI